MTSLRPGDRVRILHCPAGWLPVWLLGTLATVERTNAAGVTIRPDVVRWGFTERYVPRGAAHCLERMAPGRIEGVLGPRCSVLGSTTASPVPSERSTEGRAPSTPLSRRAERHPTVQEDGRGGKPRPR